MELLASLVLVLSVVATGAEDDKQTWAIITKYGIDVDLTCNNTLDWGIHVESGDRLSWRRKDQHEPLTNSSKFELSARYGIENMVLTVKANTLDEGGVYLCDVRTESGAPRGTIVKGLNVGTYERDEKIDKYREGIVTGVIAGASVFVLVVGIGLLENFRYLTEDQLQKRADRKQLRREQARGWKDGGHFNMAADIDMKEEPTNGSLGKADQDYTNTHL